MEHEFVDPDRLLEEIAERDRRITELENAARENEFLHRRIGELECAREHDCQLHQSLETNLEEVTIFSERLIRLVEITNALDTAPDGDTLCQMAVELARDRLGFPSISLWFQGEQPGDVVGSFWTDGFGRTVDERGLRETIAPNTPEGRVLLSHEPLILEANTPVTDEIGELVGYATKVLAAVWDGEKVIGYVSMDNRVDKRDFSREDTEIFRLFGAVIGSLFARKQAENQKNHLIGELREATEHIKHLHGMLPICASCKKIRDDEGYWQQIEHYITERSDAIFSHGICPDCAKDLYPQLYEKYLKENEKSDTPMPFTEPPASS